MAHCCWAKKQKQEMFIHPPSLRYGLCHQEAGFITPLGAGEVAQSGETETESKRGQIQKTYEKTIPLPQGLGHGASRLQELFSLCASFQQGHILAKAASPCL